MTTSTKQVTAKSQRPAPERPAPKRREKPAARRREPVKQSPAKQADRASAKEDNRPAKAHGMAMVPSMSGASFFQPSIPAMAAPKEGIPLPELDWKSAEQGMRELWGSIAGVKAEGNTLQSNESPANSSETEVAFTKFPNLRLQEEDETTKAKRKIGLWDWTAFPSQEPKRVQFWARIIDTLREHRATATKRRYDDITFAAKLNKYPNMPFPVRGDQIGKWNEAFPRNWRMPKDTKMTTPELLQTTDARQRPAGTKTFHFPWQVMDGKLMPALENPTLDQIRDVVMKLAILRLHHEKPNDGLETIAEDLGVALTRAQKHEETLRDDLKKLTIPFIEATQSVPDDHPLYWGYSTEKRTALEYSIVREIFRKHGGDIGPISHELHLRPSQVRRLAAEMEKLSALS